MLFEDADLYEAGLSIQLFAVVVMVESVKHNFVELSLHALPRRSVDQRTISCDDRLCLQGRNAILDALVVNAANRFEIVDRCAPDSEMLRQ